MDPAFNLGRGWGREERDKVFRPEIADSGVMSSIPETLFSDFGHLCKE